MIYLDHAATTPMRPGVWEAMAPFATRSFGNSSGAHDVSRRAKNALEEAREQTAALIGANPLEVVFTSGGTEADNLALKGVAFNGGGRNGVVTVATEHSAVLEPAYMMERLGFPVSIVGVDRSGRVDEKSLAEAVDDSTAVVSVMLVNNETGVVQDIRSIRESLPDGVLLHTDAVQAYGSMDLDVDELGVDLMTIAGHKFGGPKGAGILYVRDGTHLEPLMHGGGQELGRRSGTHDVASAVGLATAMGLAASDRERYRREVGAIRDGFEKQLVAGVEGAVVNTPSENRSHNHLNIRFPGVRNETLLLRLDQEGVAASAASACQSGAATVSHVLESMGLRPGEARESVRFSFGWSSTAEEAEDAAAIVIDLVSRLR